MNVLFLTLLDFNSYSEHNIYSDLLREFIINGHDVYCISPTERRTGIKTHFEENNHLLKLQIGNTQKTNIIEKGISTLLIEPQFVSAIKKYFSDVKFDLIMYSTPPITLQKAVKFVKKRDNAKTYLLLKDIFPQNAVDIGMMSKSGLHGLLYKYFRSKEKKLYAISDKIGCMSNANVKYLLEHNPEVTPEKAEVCPNCIAPVDMSITDDIRVEIRNKYGIPLDKTVFVYGGNLGKPQGIPHILECLKSQANNNDIFFLIVGDGTEYNILEDFIAKSKQGNVKLMKKLPKNDYDRMISACDAGMIFLDYRFTIPNFPSRLLTYMQASLPVIASTDKNTDVGSIIEEGEFGWCCAGDSTNEFCSIMSSISSYDLKAMGEKALEFLQNNYTASIGYSIISSSFVKTF